MNEPKIRFQGFEEKWRKTNIGKLFKERNERNSDGELLSVTMHYGVVKASTIDRADSSSTDKSHYKLVCEGDIAYNSMRMWQGACGLSHYTGIVSPAYTVISPKTEMATDFFVRLFKNNTTLKTFRLNSQGLTSDTWNLKYPTLSNISVYSPTSKRARTCIKLLWNNRHSHHHLHLSSCLSQADESSESASHVSTRGRNCTQNQIQRI